jgi:hypothetical protein
MTVSVSSPEATGGAGTNFEYDVAAILLSRLLRGADIPVGLHAPLARVAFQQSNEGYPLDDVVAWSPEDKNGTEPSIQIQVKRHIKVIASDSEFNKVVGAVVAACNGRPELIKSRQLLFGLAARPSPTDHLDELAELTAKARAHSKSDTFGRLFRERITNAGLRDRLDVVRATVAGALGTSADNRTAVDPLTHQILLALYVWPVAEGLDSRDRREEVNSLKLLADAAGQHPDHIMGKLLEIAREFGPRSGNVDAGRVRDELARFDIRLPEDATGIRHSASGTVIHAHDSSKVFHSDRDMHFGDLYFDGRTPEPGGDDDERRKP